MANLTDPNEVLLTGENSFMRLTTDREGPETTKASHWRILYSPAGQGHALFMHSELTDGEVRAYSDNIALARWLQEEIESLLNPTFADQGVPVIDADFTTTGDGRSFWTETVDSMEATLTLTWHDFAEPFVLRAAAGAMPGIPLGVYSFLLPARRAQITVDDAVAGGSPMSVERDGHESSSACVAWSETWVKPR